jgi:hypothetical protein
MINTNNLIDESIKKVVFILESITEPSQCIEVKPIKVVFNIFLILLFNTWRM